MSTEPVGDSRLRQIQNEINTDPLVRGYAGMTDAAIATDMSDATLRTITFAIPMSDIETAIRTGGKWIPWNERGEEQSVVIAPDDSKVTGTHTHTVEFTGANIREFMQAFSSSLSQTSQNLNDAYWDGILTQAVADGDLGAAVKVSLQDLCRDIVSRGQEQGWGTDDPGPSVSEADVTAAKGLT